MATEQRGFHVGTLVAGADLSALQFTFVKLNNSGAVVACASLGEPTIGVLQNKPVSGGVCDIMVSGVTKLVANAAITAGDKLMTAATGKAATAATAGSTIVGFAAQGAGAADVIFTAVINCAHGIV